MKLPEVTEQVKQRHGSRINNWKDLSDYLKTCRIEGMVLELMAIELEGRRRMDIVQRLHSKFCTLRRDRERKDLARLLSHDQ